MKQQHTLISILLLLMFLSGVIPQNAAAISSDGKGVYEPNFQVFEIDSFTYRASFRLGDNTEMLLIRCSFSVQYFYQHHHPTVSEHYISAFVGFYYGKTMLGRNVLSNITVDSVAFYPKWIDSAGYHHDFVFDTPIFVINNTIRDNHLTGGMVLIDQKPVTRYLSQFGGTFVFTGLSFTLNDGNEISLADSEIQIIVEKHNNDMVPKNATLNGNDDLTYSSDAGIINISAAGTAPLLVILDLIIGLSMIGLVVSVITLGVLHIKGRITLPIGGVKKLIYRARVDVGSSTR